MNKFTKRALSLFLSIMLVITAFSAAVLNVSAFTYNDFTYIVNEDETVTITMCDPYTNSTVKIPSEIGGRKVVAIGDNAFSGCIYITEVIIPDTVTKIGDGAFSNTHIEKINLDPNITYIGKSAFYGCEHIESLDMRALTLTYLGEDAFAWCTGLVNFRFPKGIETVPKGCFCGCKSLFEANFKYSDVKAIDNLAFYQCEGLKYFSFPEKLETIGSSAFAECTSLKLLYLPETIRTIKAGAFEGSPLLNTIYFTGSIPTWYNEVTIEKNNDYLKKAKVYFTIDNMYYVFVNDSIYIGFYDSDAMGEVEIPESIDSYPIVGIDAEAFAQSQNVTSVIIPKTITNIDKRAFSGSNLVSVAVSSDNPRYSSLNGVLFNKDKSRIVFYPTNKDTLQIPACVAELGDYSFEGTKLTEINIPANVISMGEYVFTESSVEKFSAPEKLSDIKEYTFKDCKSLSEVKVHTAIKHIGFYAFRGCDAFSEVTYVGDNAEKTINSLKVDKGNDLFVNCETVKFENIYTDRQVERIYALNKTAGNGEITVLADFNDGTTEDITSNAVFKNIKVNGSSKTEISYSYKGKTVTTVI